MTNKCGVIGISGVSESRSALIISQITKNGKGQSLIITATENRARRLADDLSFFTGKNIIVMPNEDHLFLSYETNSNDQLNARLSGMNALRKDPDCIVIAPVTAAIKKAIPHSVFESRSIRLAYGEECDPGKLREELVELGYERMGMVESRGEFSMRGGIVDVFAPDAVNPYRIEFFDTEIDRIREFDIDTQRSDKALKEIEIGPAQTILADRSIFRTASENVRRAYTEQAERLGRAGKQYEEAVETLKKRRNSLCDYIDNVSNVQLLENYLHYFYDSGEYLWDYMQDGNLIIDDPDRICEFLDARSKEQQEDYQMMLERGQIVPADMAFLTGSEDLMKAYTCSPVWVITPFPKMIRGISEYSEVRDYHSLPMAAFNGRMDVLESELNSFVKKRYSITIVCSTKERLDNLREFVERAGFGNKIRLCEGNLSSGMDFPQQKICYISDSDIFGVRKARKRRKKKKYEGWDLEHFTDLKPGDYVVHEGHGIGRFMGIQQLNIHGEQKDYLKIRYAGSDMLYVPVEQFDIVQKYIGSEDKVPKLNKLSGTEWRTTKAKARKAIADMADELISLYAERKIQKGFAFGPDTEWQREFEDRFPFVETDDQLNAVREIKGDMEKPEAMDRLLCGDVGFGKTEVAARALFKCVADGKQAAVLVPTTLLASQHYYTLKERFESFPVNIDVLSRFRSDAEAKTILKKLAAGQIDLIIGTHRLLSSDVKYKDLGLLVVDEEQRFGVKHKEKIKAIKKNVDVLTLTATPIPRTLNMSLTGIKDMSVIEEPPDERLPVQTYVMEQDDSVIREAIIREMNRGGQTLVIFNRVRGINQVADRIRSLVPEAHVVTGHGRMNEQTLENVMLDFLDGESDVLVATTIIENGIDIRNANTLIILDADRYGLAQLYQLRGRVGRSNRMAFAYLMYQKDKVLTEIAEKRLRTIREFTEFGSGIKVAMRDLQLRGAGNLLGSEQSGHMLNIGYELYCKLVNEAVRKLKGENVSETPDESSIELAVAANIPNWYIGDETLKIQMYKKIAAVRGEEDEEALYDELVDRFGDVPAETRNLLKVSRIRGLAEELSVSRIFEKDRYIIFNFEEKSPLTAEGIIRIRDVFNNRAFVHGGVKPFVRIPGRQKTKLDDTIRLLSVMKGEQ